MEGTINAPKPPNLRTLEGVKHATTVRKQTMCLSMRVPFVVTLHGTASTTSRCRARSSLTCHRMGFTISKMRRIFLCSFCRESTSYDMWPIAYGFKNRMHHDVNNHVHNGITLIKSFQMPHFWPWYGIWRYSLHHSLQIFNKSNHSSQIFNWSKHEDNILLITALLWQIDVIFLMTIMWATESSN